jgi:hypothetical protein
VGIPLTVRFRLSWSLRLSRILFTNSSSFHDRILAITKPFTRNFSFFTMEFWLSRSLHTNFFLFSRWNSGYQEAFHTNFFLSHGGISAITEPFTQTFFFFFHDGILAIRESFTRTFFFFHVVETRLSRSLFTNFSFT